MPVNKEHRSAMSVSMTIVLNGKRREDLEKKFVSESHAQGLIQVQRFRGGEVLFVVS
jgi:phosphoserine aminotransferase